MKASFLYKTFGGRALTVVVLCILFYLLAKATSGLLFPALFSISLYGGIVWIFLGSIKLNDTEESN